MRHFELQLVLFAKWLFGIEINFEKKPKHQAKRAFNKRESTIINIS
jgi:hypothetical protein